MIGQQALIASTNGLTEISDQHDDLRSVVIGQPIAREPQSYLEHLSIHSGLGGVQLDDTADCWP
jgi:hypothetical protein